MNDQLAKWARHKVGQEIKKGRISRPETCQRCGETGHPMKDGRVGLLPCPFCGSEPEHLSVPGGMWVRCPVCKASSDDSNAIAAWNRRALPPVDGLEVVGHVKPEHSEAVEPLFVRELSQPWMEGIFAVPVVTLSQASSVIAGLTKERDHWKANHDQMVQRNSVLRERPDLPADRLPAIARYEARISSLEEENKRMREALKPFAKAADIKLCGEWRDDERFGQTDVSFHLTFGHLRAASQALEDHNG